LGDDAVYKPEKIIVSNIVLGPDALFIVDESNHLYKIDLNGNLVWKTDCEVSPWFLETHLIGAGTILYCIRNVEEKVAVTRSFVTAYSMEDGSRLWDIDFGRLHHVRASPAVADGILVVGNMWGEVIALASSPYLFVKQGDIFLLKGRIEDAIRSYEKAVELYEIKGDICLSQEIQERIRKLRNPSESPLPESIASAAPPESALPSTPESTSQPSTPESIIPTTLTEPPEHLILFSAVMILFAVLVGIPIVYHLIKHRKSNND